MSNPSQSSLEEISSLWAIPIYQPGQTQLHFLIKTPQGLQAFCAKLYEMGYYLVTMVANDERELEDHCFKIYHLFSHPTDNLFVTLEYSIPHGQNIYPSIIDNFPAAQVFQDEIADLFGLFPDKQSNNPGYHSCLHDSYPENFYPLRRDMEDQSLKVKLKDVFPVLSYPAALRMPEILPKEGVFIPVGPIHAGVIEPGNFLFHLGGETIDQLEIWLGYTHRGIERLFQNSCNLLDGWRLAEKVSGDTSFAHSLAYCKAVESLLRVNITDEVNLVRAIFLELERLCNHIGDCSALIHDLALEIVAADISVLREKLLRLNHKLTGSRFLRGVNKPGGISLPEPLKKQELLGPVQCVVETFMNWAHDVLLRTDFRERTVNTGVLSHKAALRLGITGLAARASGVSRDFRLQHSFGPYCEEEIRDMLQNAKQQIALPFIRTHIMSGDIFSRFVQRVIEIDLSRKLIEKFLDWLGESSLAGLCAPINSSASAYEIGLGYVEGWRGDIIYWVMKDKLNGIFRCKVRDPSLINWAGLREAIVSTIETNPSVTETALVDFPLINKSFNLSYSGVDL